MKMLVLVSMVNSRGRYMLVNEAASYPGIKRVLRRCDKVVGSSASAVG